MTPLRVEAALCGPLCGDPPMLDALLEAAEARRLGLPPLCRAEPAPVPLALETPLAVGFAGGEPVGRASSPVFAADSDGVRHLCRRFPDRDPLALAPGDRRTSRVDSGPLKSWRLPLRERVVPRVVWFALGDAGGVRSLLAGVHSLGKASGKGPGRVASWSVEAVAEDWSWFAPSPAGPVLMRPLPWAEGADWLPPGLLGARRDFGACQPPYWHPDRYREVVSPW